MAVALIGHRGYREWDPQLAPAQQIPENSIAAFQRSYGQKGLDGIELDVHLSRDNRLVVFHDDELNELTNVTDLLRQPVPDPATGRDPLAAVNGVDLTRLRALQANDPAGQGNLYIADLALREIQALRLKSHPDETGVRHATVHAIPTLTEVFRAVDLSRASHPADQGNFQINIEVKEAKMYQRRADGAVLATESGSHLTTNKDIAGTVTRTIDDFLKAEPAPQARWSKADNLVVSSFHMMTLGRLRHADPQIPRRALYSTFVPRDFRVSADGKNLEMKNRDAQDQPAPGRDPKDGWIAVREALATDRLFTDFNTHPAQNERIWDLTEAEFAAQFAADQRLHIQDLHGTTLHDADGRPLLGVAPGSVAISISEMTPRVAQIVRDSGADICVWTANEQSTALRPQEETSALLRFLATEGVGAFITDNSDHIVRARAAWRERELRDPVAGYPQQQTAIPIIEPPTGLEETHGPRPSPQRRPAGLPSIPSLDVPRSPTQSWSPPPSRREDPGAVEPPQRRGAYSIPLIPEGLPADARQFSDDGSTPRNMAFDAMFGNGLSQTVAMCIAYGVALGYIQAFVSQVMPNGGATFGKKLLLAAAQGLGQAPLLAPLEESIFGLAAEAGAAALGGAVVARSDPYPEFKLPAVPADVAQPGGLEALRAHNRALHYARTHGGIERTYEAQNHPFSTLVPHPEPGTANYPEALNHYNDPAQVELRRKAEGILRNRPIELSDDPFEHDVAPRHVRDERRQWLQDRHSAEVAHANDLLRRPEYAPLNIEPIPARGPDVASYDHQVRAVRGFLQQRSRELAVARLAFAHDQRSADYGSFPIDIVLIGSFALFAGISAAVFSPGPLQTTAGTTLAGTVFGALNNYWRLQNRHQPGELAGAPAGQGAHDDFALAERGVARRGRNARDTDSIPTHYVQQGRGLQHGWEVFQEIWNGISDSERLPDGVLGARGAWEKARNHAQQLLSYVIGSSYGLVAYNVVHTAIDHAVGGSQGRWQSFLKETVATAAFVGSGDLSILHYSIYGRRGVTGVSPAYAATREAYEDLWKTATGRELYSTVDRNKLTRTVNQAYDTLQKALRLTQHGVMDTVNLAVTPLMGRAAAEQRSADTRQWYGQNVSPRTVYGPLPYEGPQEIDTAARVSALQSLSGNRALSDDEAVKRLQVLRGKADNFWDAERRLEELWREIAPTLSQGQHRTAASTAPQPPVHGPVEALAADRPPGEGLLKGWRPEAEQLSRCAEVLQQLKEAREAIDTLRRAEINVRQARNEQATELALTSIVKRLAESRADGHATTNDITDLLRGPASGIDHQSFQTMLDKVIGQNAAAAQLNRGDLLAKGYQGINERAVTLVSDVMTDLLKKGKQDTSDVAAVMETLVDDARRTGMTDIQFNAIIHEQFHQAAQNATGEARARLTNAQPVIVQRTRERYAQLAGHEPDHRRILDNLEKELGQRPPAHRRR